MLDNQDILQLKDTTRKLSLVNREVERFLDRLPLDHHDKLAKLNQLIHWQRDLANTPLKRNFPLRVSLLFENARDRASFLRQRYDEALMRGELRRSSTCS